MMDTVLSAQYTVYDVQYNVFLIVISDM
jgi:hypothetical protein